MFVAIYYIIIEFLTIYKSEYGQIRNGKETFIVN
jgi:hypothetical protein